MNVDSMLLYKKQKRNVSVWKPALRGIWTMLNVSQWLRLPQRKLWHWGADLNPANYNNLWMAGKTVSTFINAIHYHTSLVCFAGYSFSCVPRCAGPCAMPSIGMDGI